MGRLLLLLVTAAAIGGSVLTLNTRGTLFETSKRHAEGQEDVLAREIAEAGQSLALREMIGADGFTDPTAKLGDKLDYDGGTFRIDYIPGSSDHEASIRITGMYGGAIHTIESTYELDPMDAPGPLWLDVPYATASVAKAADISGSAGDHPVYFDRRLHDELDLESLAPIHGMEADLGAGMREASSALAVPAADAWEGEAGLLGDLDVKDAEGLYTKATNAMTGSDVTIPGDHTEAGSVTWGTVSDGTRITHVDGDLTITGSVTGAGVLVVSGALAVEDGGPGAADDGELVWSGIVIVRDTTSLLPVDLDGRVEIDGMIVVSHQAFPPGGHLDVSVYRDEDGMSPSQPAGDRSETPARWRNTNGSLRPDAMFHQHTHAFDITAPYSGATTAPRGDDVVFLEDGAPGIHEIETQFKSLLDRLGSEEVYLEFGNASNHGYSQFRLDVAGTDGTGDEMTRTVGAGFGPFARADDPHRSRAFAADQLQSLEVDVASLRGLLKAFDTMGACPSPNQWPSCIGSTWDRHGALAVRIRRASDDARLYESTLYWHMRTDEQAAHEAEEQAWRDKIEAGDEFGTRLSLGDRADITFDLEAIKKLTEKLDFEGDRVVLLASTSSHLTGRDTANGIPMCHKPGSGNAQTKYFDTLDDAHGHLNHSRLGVCSAEDVASGRSGRSGGSGRIGGSGRGSQISICLAGNEYSIPSGELGVYVALGATEGSCSVTP